MSGDTSTTEQHGLNSQVIRTERAAKIHAIDYEAAIQTPTRLVDRIQQRNA